jgi:hypothetical protein
LGYLAAAQPTAATTKSFRKIPNEMKAIEAKEIELSAGIANQRHAELHVEFKLLAHNVRSKSSVHDEPSATANIPREFDAGPQESLR